MTNLFQNDFKRYPHEQAAVLLSEAQHAPGVTVRMNKRNFRVEYVTPEGKIVPGYNHFLRVALGEETGAKS